MVSDEVHLQLLPVGMHKQMKKALGKMQTLCAGCSKAEPKNFAPLHTPFPGAQDGQNLISWRWSLSSPTDPVWWRSMHAISSYHGNRTTKPQTPPARPLQTGPITIHCATKLSMQCNYRQVEHWSGFGFGIQYAGTVRVREYCVTIYICMDVCMFVYYRRGLDIPTTTSSIIRQILTESWCEW